jgi:hypothetical protein
MGNYAMQAFVSNEASRLSRMPQRRESRFRDYAYVSARKVMRISKTLEPSVWSRIHDLQVKFGFGPVGATFNFDADARPEDVIILVTEVERAIRQEFGVHDLNDPGLRVGHWFEVTGIPMIYGVPYSLLGGVLFLGPAGSAHLMGQPDAPGQPGPTWRRFALGGSSEYLLDRGAADGQSPGAGSLPRSIREMLHAFADESLDYWDRLPAFDQVNFARLATMLNSGGEPMTTLARCLDIVTDPPVVIGTPLYVSFHAPD